MHRDVTRLSKSCIDWQNSKVSRHNHLSPAHFVSPDGRFKHIHMDLVGPLPNSDGFKYCLTMIDRFSRWPEAVPLPNIEALTVCRAFVDTWISRYGSPETLATDQGSQLISRLFTALLQLTGCHRIRTTAYHPSSNEMIERWHRSFKAVISKLRRFFYKDLPSSSHVFLRVRAARGSLERPNNGPHKVIRRTSGRVYEIDVCGTPR